MNGVAPIICPAIPSTSDAASTNIVSPARAVCIRVRPARREVSICSSKAVAGIPPIRRSVVDRRMHTSATVVVGDGVLNPSDVFIVCRPRYGVEEIGSSERICSVGSRAVSHTRSPGSRRGEFGTSDRTYRSHRVQSARGGSQRHGRLADLEDLGTRVVVTTYFDCLLGRFA